jgi:hypothetical protein
MPWINICTKAAKDVLETYYSNQEVKILPSSNEKSMRITIDDNQDILISLPPLGRSETEIKDYVSCIVRRIRGEEDSKDFRILETLGGISTNYYKIANILCIPRNEATDDSISLTTITKEDDNILTICTQITTKDYSNNIVVYFNEQRTINIDARESTSIYNLPEAEWQQYIKTIEDFHPNPYNEPIWETIFQYKDFTHYYGKNIFVKKESAVAFLMMYGIWTPIPKQWVRTHADKFPENTRNELDIVSNFGYI